MKSAVRSAAAVSRTTASVPMPGLRGLGDLICYDGETMAGCYQCRMAASGVASIRHQHRSSHGLVRSPEQIAKRTALDAAIAEEAAQLELYIDAEMIFNTFGLSTDRVVAMSTIERECWVLAAIDCPRRLLYLNQWEGLCDG